MNMNSFRLSRCVYFLVILLLSLPAKAVEKPNILVIWGDDIGWSNIGVCHRGMLGIDEKDPTLAELLKPLGYTSGQFGKNHLGDRDQFSPTNQQ